MSKLAITFLCIASFVLINGQIGAGAGEQKYMLVQGEQDENGTWVLQPSYQMEFPAGTQNFAEIGQGNFSIVLMNNSGNVIAIKYFEPQPSHIDISQPRMSIASPLSFIEIIPLPEDVVIIELRERNVSLARKWRSENTPVVEIISPSGSGVNNESSYIELEWIGRDADNDSLSYLVQYNRGPSRGRSGERQDAEWRTVAANLKAEKLPIDLSKLPGGDRARMRVLATDGFNTGVAVSPSFKVENKPPVASIIYPSPASLTPGSRSIIIEKGDRLVLIGTATDIEDGVLNGSALSWYSSRDGLLGTGCRLDVTVLSPGVHEITLRALDNDGHVGRSNIIVEVTRPINRQPIANAGQDQVMNLLLPIKLNGTGSFDEDGNKLFYNWSVVKGPAGSKPVISDPNVAEPTFAPDASGEYEIELSVSDGVVGSMSDSVLINVKPRPIIFP